jgi:hypothetical protein
VTLSRVAEPGRVSHFAFAFLHFLLFRHFVSPFSSPVPSFGSSDEGRLALIGRSGIEINQPPVSFSNSSMTSDDAGLLFSEPGFEMDLTPSLFFLVITHLP